jgi:hypothetical protein
LVFRKFVGFGFKEYFKKLNILGLGLSLISKIIDFWVNGFGLYHETCHFQVQGELVLNPYLGWF